MFFIRGTERYVNSSYLSLVASATNIDVGEDVLLCASLNDKNCSPLFNKEIVFYEGNSVIGMVLTDSSGDCELLVSPTVTSTFSCEFKGDNENLDSHSEIITVTVEDNDVLYFDDMSTDRTSEYTAINFASNVGSYTVLHGDGYNEVILTKTTSSTSGASSWANLNFFDVVDCDAFLFETEFYVEQKTNNNGIQMTLINPENTNQMQNLGTIINSRQANSYYYYQGGASAIFTQTLTTFPIQTWYKYKMKVENQTVTYIIEDMNGNTLLNRNHALNGVFTNNFKLGVGLSNGSGDAINSTGIVRFRNIKVTKSGGGVSK